MDQVGNTLDIRCHDDPFWMHDDDVKVSPHCHSTTGPCDGRTYVTAEVMLSYFCPSGLVYTCIGTSNGFPLNLYHGLLSTVTPGPSTANTETVGYSPI